MMKPPSVTCGVPGCKFPTGVECFSYKYRREELCLHVNMVHMLRRLEERKGELMEEKVPHCCMGVTRAQLAWKGPVTDGLW